MDNDLLKVMIVDDEEKTRDLLKECINWDEVGMYIAGEASSGREALDLLEDINPDIIITDVRMPFMDGLEFSSIVVERYPHIKVMVLTAYEEFEYAKRGIKVGISDFLLKPIRRSDLKKAIINLRNKIEEERSNRNDYIKLKKQLEESFPYLKEKFLNDLLQSSYSIDNVKDKLAYFSVENLLNHVQIALIQVTRSKASLNGSEEENVILDLMCTKIVKQYFKDDANVNVFNDNSGRIVILNSDSTLNITECCEQIKIMLINRLKCYVCIGIGNVYSGIKGIKRSYKDACEALNYKVVYGKNQVISFSDISISDKSSDIKTDEINEIGFYVKVGIEEKAIEVIDRIFDDISIVERDTLEKIRMISVNIVITILNSITELGINYYDIFKSKNLPYSDILIIDTIPEMKEYLNRLVVCVISEINRARAKKNNKVISNIIDYMHKNVSDSELSLSNVANKFYLNPSYLSRIFKQETGQTFVEYITKVRIEKALGLFKETDLMAYEVAEKVGIPDPNYFGKCFKKYTGMSINDYKKMQEDLST